MHKNLLQKIALYTLLLLGLCFTESWSQAFREGVRQGVVKVKFASAMSETVSNIKMSARSSGLVTGIASFDMAAKTVNASTMYRLFPYDAKNENKLRQHGLHLWYVVEIDANTDPRTAVSQFKKLSEIQHAEVDLEKTLAPYEAKEYQARAGTFSTPPFNDPYLKDQWHYNNEEQSGFGDADVNLFKAWESVTGSNDVIVSVHDEGVDVKHEDLKANIWVNAGEIPGNGIDDDSNGFIDDVNGFNFSKNRGAIDPQHHGTHVAGTIAAVTNNGKGVSGIAGGNGTGNGARIMSCQILGGGLIERSYVYAANNGAVISQNSWGYTTEDYFDQSVLDAIKYFIAEAGNYEGSPMRGGVVIFAAGNSNMDGAWYPGRYDHVLSVSAVGPEWKKAAYSNYGSWVELSAPGGDQINYNGINGVLSTIPGNKYAYMQGTSMACPHVSGIAALVLANRKKQFTAAELWKQLVTGVVPIDEMNSDYIGKLGSGAIDAALAIQQDEKISPEIITDMTVDGVAQEFATVSWTVPNDADDTQPTSFTLYSHTQPITTGNLIFATRQVIPNTQGPGAKITFEVADLLGFTTYYFAVTSTDRWGNTSTLSNIPSAATNAGPAISVTAESIALEIDASVSSTGTSTFGIINSAEGVLRWESFMRHRAITTTFNAASIHYPVAAAKVGEKTNIARASSREAVKTKTTASPSAFNPVQKSFSGYATDIVGETDISIPNSAAGRFFVEEPEGFNLTDVGMYLKHDPTLGPVVIEVFKGASPTKENLIYAQEYASSTANETWATIVLDEQIYFTQGETFWLAFHVPAGNLFPLGIGFENTPESSTHCFMSLNVGATWMPLEEALNDKGFAWVMSAGSYNPFVGTYLTLDPQGSDVPGNEQTTVTLTADASQLINGEYAANLVLSSNDADTREIRIPVSLVVTGQKPDVKHTDIADFGSIFVGSMKTLDVVLDNQGFGSLSDVTYSVEGSDFRIESSPYSLSARESSTLQVVFEPQSPGNKNAVLTFSNEQYTYSISLFGVGAETSRISVSPESQLVDNLAIGDPVTVNLTVENTGAYPLKYFVPGFDTKGVSDSWPSAYHKYGYKVRSNRDTEANPVDYNFEDISTTGIDITSSLIKDDVYFGVDLGFTFPFYGKDMHRIYIAQKGFTAFDNTVRPINTPVLNNSNSPGGYISPLGTWLTYIAEGKIFYQLQPDRLIIQYDHVTDGSAGYLTAQMVLHANGDIRFYYNDITYSEWALSYLNILMEDIDHTDGILVHDYAKPVALYNGLALGFDYPGPQIITGIANGSGIIAPGSSASMEINLETASLAEGSINRYINIISNDPANSQKVALVELNITSGGVANPVVSTATMAFGDVFQGAVRSQKFTVKNEGTASTEIQSIALANSAFEIEGTVPVVIKPGAVSTYVVTIPTSVVANLSDVLTIGFADGSSTEITITGNVVPPPAISVDLSALDEAVAYGDTKRVPFSLSNPGESNLEVSVTGKPWVRFESTEVPAAFSYRVQKENTGGIYQWIDIRRTGTQLPFAIELDDEAEYWRSVELPFAFPFYGKQHSKIMVGENGIVSFEEAPPTMMFPDSIPSAIHEGAYVMPYWLVASFNTTNFKKEDVGIFHQADSDKVIITWSYLVNFFGGMGDPISVQLILYKNGQMKFQYQVEESGQDLTSNTAMIGLQESIGKGVIISDRLALDFGKGLAYNLLPIGKFNVAPSAELVGEIVLDATHTYGGTYAADLEIATNVPGSEQLLKPVTLTIEAESALTTTADVDFGNKIIATEYGQPVSYPVEVELLNTGTTPVDLSWISYATGNQSLGLELFVLIDGWMGPAWQWADASMVFSEWSVPSPVFQIMPGDKLKARATFYPSAVGEFADEVIITTTAGEKRISLKGVAVEPPSLQISRDPINLVLNAATEVADRSIAFNNVDGKSPLAYHIEIDYDRHVTGQSNESIASKSSGRLKQTPATTVSGVSTNSTYNRTLKLTNREAPDNHVGTEGAEPFTVATKFNSGNAGFNLSHVETWFRAETMSTGIIEVEIRAGASITESTTLLQDTIQFSRSGDDLQGNWMQLALQHPVFIYPNEDFYVLITYPFEINFPQGIVKNEPVSPGTYLYSENGQWLDIQNEEGFYTAAWLMYAAEETEQTSTWITVTSPQQGSLDAGESSAVDLSFFASLASPGDQLATVVITTNDPANKRVLIPVKLHRNEAPVFVAFPEEVVVQENDTLVVTVPVTDRERNTITVSVADAHNILSNHFESDLLRISLTPAFGDAGRYTVRFTAVDEHDAATEAEMIVLVRHTNQAPVYVGSHEPLSVTRADDMREYAIADFFADPDEDAFRFSAESADEDVVEVFSSANKFLLNVKKPGSTEITFSVTDSLGATLDKTLPIVVNVVLGMENDAQAQGVRAFPNPAEHSLTVQFNRAWKGTKQISMLDVSGKIIFTTQVDGEKALIDVSSFAPGFYLLKAAGDRQSTTKKILIK